MQQPLRLMHLTGHDQGRENFSFDHHGFADSELKVRRHIRKSRVSTVHNGRITIHAISDAGVFKGIERKAPVRDDNATDNCFDTSVHVLKVTGSDRQSGVGKD